MKNIRLSKEEMKIIEDVFTYKDYHDGLDLEEYLLYKKMKEFLE